MQPLFSPSVHTQRHQYVVHFVKTHAPKKVVDLGCNDCSLLRKLKFHREIELLCGVDLDAAAMKKKMHELAPIPTDYLQPGPAPLSVELYQGSVTQKDARLRGFDLVTGIELIEHLHPDEVELFTEVLFGYMTPAAAIVSTPNVEFNPLFPRMPGFRNPDHKFEWTRAEFQSWALEACGRYGYQAEFTGVGQAVPHLHLQVGFCSQIALFRRLGGGGAHPASSADAGEVFSYQLLYSVSYPSLRDNNILQGCLVSEVLYWAHQLSGRRKRREDGEEGWSPTEQDSAESEPTDEFEEGVFDGEAGTHGWEDMKMTSRGQLESYRQGRCVCVPLRRVWSCCARVRELSGSLARLRLFIADDPLVQLSQDGSAVLLDEGQEFSEEEEEQEEEEDTGSIEPAASHAGEEESWDLGQPLPDHVYEAQEVLRGFT